MPQYDIEYLVVDGEYYCFVPSWPKLGEGATSEVYLGYKCGTNEQFAIKRLRPEYLVGHTDLVRNEVSFHFNHANIVNTIGLGVSTSIPGQLYIVTQYIDGQTADVWLENGYANLDASIRVNLVVKCGCQVLSALSSIHNAGFVHRDIKPSNIMITKSDGVAKLMDFGIAEFVQDNSPQCLVGTPEYLAPEQIPRSYARCVVDARADIYAVGISLYQMITGVSPFAAESLSDILYKKLNGELPPNQLVPEKLRKILLKATRKQASERYATADEMREALEGFLGENTDDNDDSNYLGIVIVAVLAVIVVLLVLISSI